MTNPIESQVPHDLNAGGEAGKERLEEMHRRVVDAEIGYRPHAVGVLLGDVARLLADALSRRSSDEAGVRVKALIWSEFTSDENVMFMTAAGFGVRYEVFHKASDVAKIGIQVARFLRHADDLTIADEDELDDSERVSILGYAADLAGAYAMAQADYDPRILSAIDQFAFSANSSTLSPSPSIRAEPVAWMYEYLKGYDGDMPLWGQPQLGLADPRPILGDDVRNVTPLFASKASAWHISPRTPSHDLL